MRSAITRGLIVLPSLLASWHFIGQLFAPDACLDHGGSFNYASWECGYAENFPYIATPFYSLGSFWLFFGCAIASVVALRFHRRGSNDF
jgi:hypothetical protein